MNILLTNDDGVESKGIWSLFNLLSEAGHNVWMVAPKFEKSATSHALTIREPLRIEHIQEKVWAVTGTPVDCVILALEHILKDISELKTDDSNQLNIDLVISGINAGQNIGDDILYSGTVGAAIEAMCFGYKAIAISVTSYENQKYETAAKALLDLLENGILNLIEHREILNINVPNVDIKDIKDYLVTQTGFRRYQNILFKQKDHRDRDIYWIGGDNPVFEKSEFMLDADAVKENYISISPLKIDYNNYEKINTLSKWLENYKVVKSEI